MEDAELYELMSTFKYLLVPKKAYAVKRQITHASLGSSHQFLIFLKTFSFLSCLHSSGQFFSRFAVYFTPFKVISLDIKINVK